MSELALKIKPRPGTCMDATLTDIHTPGGRTHAERRRGGQQIVWNATQGKTMPLKNQHGNMRLTCVYQCRFYFYANG